jgi:prepilin peptidase CpaA
VAGIAYAGWTDGGSGAGSALAASILVSLPCLVLYALGGGGAGDVKLMAGIGAWLGVSHGLMTLASVSLWGVVLGILRAVLSGKSAALASNLNALVRIPLQFVLAGLGIRRPLDLAAAPHPSVGTMPYGGAIGLGVITASLGDWLWHA